MIVLVCEAHAYELAMTSLAGRLGIGYRFQ